MKSKSLVRLLMSAIAVLGLMSVAYAQEAPAPAAEKAAPAVEKAAPAAEKAAPVAEKAAPVAKKKTFAGMLTVTKDATGKVTALEIKNAKGAVRNIMVDEESTKMAQDLDGKRVRVVGTMEGKEIKATSIKAAPVQAKKGMKKAAKAEKAAEPKAEATPAEAK